MSFTIGFTGSREGMSWEQYGTVHDLISGFRPTIVHHGDCIGSDVHFHIMVESRFPDTIIVVHPPVDELYRAHCMGTAVRPPRKYLDRNKDIVDPCDLLIATPKRSRSLSGGTGWTVKYAKRIGRWVITVWPDGKVDTN